MDTKNRAFLKWAGGKYSLVDTINKYLPKGDRLIEPFAGACSVFLNTNFTEYLINDINADLINMYNIIKYRSEEFIKDAEHYFDAKFNDAIEYYKIRDKFNKTKDPYLRSLLFLYMNRHGYNGLCRYNGSGGYNVPFGKYSSTYFPRKEIIEFANRAICATFTCKSYKEIFSMLRKGDVMYCDPPYVPITKCHTTYFAGYTESKFTVNDQVELTRLATAVSYPIIISNHDTPMIRELYKDSIYISKSVKRTISSNVTTRNPVPEVIALFNIKNVWGIAV